MSPTSSLRLAFVSAPGCSAFMEELLAVVADAVTGLGAADVEVITHQGLVSDVLDLRTVAVVIPHEYFAVAPELPAVLLNRVIAFGVEHPGTSTFQRSSQRAATLGGWFEIAESSMRELRAMGHRPNAFPLGYAPRWDRWGGVESERPVDVVYLGTADPRRLQILARSARELSDLRCELLTPPHEPMTATRPDFLLDEDKWRLLAASKLLLNLHRERKQAFEWVRALEAMCNGCVVLTEASDDLGPLVPGEHILVANPADMGRTAHAALAEPGLLETIAHNAYELCRTELDMARPAAELLEVARKLVTAAPERATSSTSSVTAGLSAPHAPEDEVWFAGVLASESVPGTAQIPPIGPRPGRPQQEQGLAVLCVETPQTGPWRLTQRSLPPSASLHVARHGVLASGHLDIPPRQLLPLSPETGSGAGRNLLLHEVREDLVAVLDAGDQVLGHALERMSMMLRADERLDAVVCPATHGDGPLVNVLLPEMWRLDARAYLSRGYVVRRSVLESLGGFVEDPEWERLVDHHFWVSFTRAGGRCGLLRQVGFELWPRQEPQQAAV